MAKKIDFAPFAILIGIAIVVQLALIGADSVQTPAKVARSFAEAYYYLNPGMQDYLCADLAEDGQVVGNYLYQKEREASQRGFPTNYLRQKFTKIHLTAAESGEGTAKFHLKGTTRVCINPAYMVVGKLFGFGQNYPVDETIELVKEDGQWRVCGNPFGINHPV